MKTLVVYYSYTGNTKSVAKKIAAALKADLEELIMAEPYSKDYQKVVEDTQDEVKRGYKPFLKSMQHQVKDYDCIIIGTPTFWYKMAPAVLTFLSENNFSDKTVIPFMTDAGWAGTVIKDMTKVAQKNGAVVKNAKEIKFNTNNDGITTAMETPEKELEIWIESCKNL
jgi:flavodoxin